MNLRVFKIMIAAFGFVQIVTGLIAAMGISNPLYAEADLPADPGLDSNLRYFGAFWMTIGFVMFWLVPRFREQTALFRVVWIAIFIGGLGRVLSMILVGMPPNLIVLFTFLEIVGAPVFIFWHRYTVKNTAPSSP